MMYYNKLFDFQVWLFVQWYYMPHYVIGKQDDWQNWTNTTLNGWRVSNLCKP
jgi:hypothetical protein